MSNPTQASFVQRFCDWWNLADYDAAKDEATKNVAARYGRGNVSFQNGWILDEDGLKKLSAAGDKAMAKLRRLLPSH
jgi:hypothetical protein